MANAPALRQSSSALYQSLGWSIVPADADTKAALVFWRRYTRERADLVDQEMWSRRFPTAGIAVITGMVSGIVVLDCDGQAGVREALGLGIPRTPCVRTPSGGMHFYFKHPGFDVHNAAKRGESKRLDVRGEVGYVMAPHSRRSDGRRYEWAISPRDSRVAAAPPWFAKMLEGLAIGTGAPSREPLSRSTTVYDDDLDELLQRLPMETQHLIAEGAEKGARSDADYKVVMQLLLAGVTDEQIAAIYDTYAIGEKFREPGQGDRYLGITIERARQKVRVVRIKYADLQGYDGGGQRLHLALVVDEGPEKGRMIRCGITVPAAKGDSMSIRWAAVFAAADLPVPIGGAIRDRVAQLHGRRMRVSVDADRTNPIASFHRFF